MCIAGLYDMPFSIGYCGEFGKFFYTIGSDRHFPLKPPVPIPAGSGYSTPVVRDDPPSVSRARAAPNRMCDFNP